jgi:SAM-dependent methyltransferase
MIVTLVHFGWRVRFEEGLREVCSRAGRDARHDLRRRTQQDVCDECQASLFSEQLLYSRRVRTPPTVSAAANRALKRLGIRVERLRPTSWDEQFARWVRDARTSGSDPNEVGDREWKSDLLEQGLTEHYLPFVTHDSVVVELGPGSGRLSRHLISHCKKLVVADYSELVCKWMHEYLDGKGAFEVRHITSAALPDVRSESADCVFAHGVFEHLDFDEAFWFFVDFYRVLKPGGVVAFNFDSILSDESVEVMRVNGSPAERYLFRLHHPEALARLATAAGFPSVEMFETNTRIAFARFRK